MMNEHIESPNRGIDKYVRSLLTERQRELRLLELNHQWMRAGDFLSCRRSLLQAINELETLLQTDPDELAAQAGRQLAIPVPAATPPGARNG